MTNATVPPSAAASEEAARSPQEALAAPVKLEGPRPRPTAGLRLAAFLAALAAHAAVLCALVPAALELTAGGRGRLPDAVNVTFVDSAALQSRVADRTQPPAPVADVVDARDGAPVTTPASRQAKEEKRSEKEVTQAQRQAAAPLPAETISNTPLQAENERKEATNAKAPGGRTASGRNPTIVEQVAPAAASPGAVRDYANAVAAALAKTKPRRVPAYGKLKVKLVVSPDGGFALLEILKSSGNRRLDDTVLAAMRRAKLPMPPPGLTFEERWYEFTYTFD